MPAEDLDADFESAAGSTERSLKRATITPEAFAAMPAKQVPCGFFSLTLTDGSVKRFRIRLERGHFLTGKRTLSRYCKVESDDAHEREWETIATIDAGGFNVFKRWQGHYEQQWAIQLWRLLNADDESVVRASPGYSVEVEPRCWLCMRELKTDEQKRIGLTPTCAKAVLSR